MVANNENSHYRLPGNMQKNIVDLNLFDVKIECLSNEQKIDLAKETEEAALVFDPRVNSEGSTYYDTIVETIICNSRGFSSSYKSTSCILRCRVFAGENGKRYNGNNYSIKRYLVQLKSPEDIGYGAGKHTILKLNPVLIRSQRSPVIFNPRTAEDLLLPVAEALRGDHIKDKLSFLVGKKGQKIASSLVTIIDDGTIEKGYGSRPFDDEGIKTERKTIINNGVLENFLHHIHSADDAGIVSTGNAVRDFTAVPIIGVNNFYIRPTDTSPSSIIKSVKNGLLITGLMGSETSFITGYYSRNAEGFWIENGEIVFPVNNITITGSLSEMLQNIEAIGNDLEFNGPIASPTIKISNMELVGTSTF